MKIFGCTLLLILTMFLAACQIQPVQAPSAEAAAPTAAVTEEATGEATEEAAVPAAALEGPFDVVQLIIDFEPGAWTPSHTHGGMLVVTVREGELTVRDEQGTEVTYQPGESLLEIPGVYLELGNATDSVLSVATVALLPSGEKLTTTKEGISTNDAPPGPTVLYSHTYSVTEPVGDFEMNHLVLDFAPGAWTPPHEHGGTLVNMVMAGELTVRDDQGVEKTVPAGEVFIEVPGQYLEVGNAGDTLTSVASVALLPVGAKLTTVQEGISTDKIPPGPTLLYQYKLPAHSTAAP